ncbi:hypothetical protein DOTSEDRAFT_71525 [Dothistroma septosporum NZE10]|uniref:Uncharacterized protein n=1 Tax=Dothistroma septosporum (strain NZE10 / CBS 128990) TaxID=675120 RepID=N1PR42_DOTSN|nr:hypothetical protein DOTSEDRAFT_71525 [Dothistroma septosporum NZE10]
MYIQNVRFFRLPWQPGFVSVSAVLSATSYHGQRSSPGLRKNDTMYVSHQQSDMHSEPSRLTAWAVMLLDFQCPALQDRCSP